MIFKVLTVERSKFGVTNLKQNRMKYQVVGEVEGKRRE
jgi:hypothetical protein